MEPIIFAHTTGLTVMGLASLYKAIITTKRFHIIIIFSCNLLVLLFGTWIERSDIPRVDVLVSIMPMAFTLSVICDTFNLVDRMNGLSILIGSSVAMSLVFIAGHCDALKIAIWGAVVLEEFLLLNYIRGKLFMGDASVYGVGYFLAWLGILSLYQMPGLKPLILIFVFSLPLAVINLTTTRWWRVGKPANQSGLFYCHQSGRRFLLMLASAKLMPNRAHIMPALPGNPHGF